MAPMGFSATDLRAMLSVDFNKPSNFTDNECKNTCYLYNVCRTSAADNNMLHKRFDTYNESHLKYTYCWFCEHCC